MISIKKIFTTTIILSLFFILSTSNIEASDPSFSFYPKGGTVLNKDQGFVVDILMDSGENKLASAKFTVLFDPAVLQIKKAEKNNTLFAQFPLDESTLDNENGVVMLSGFTQSGTGTLYETGEKPDVFARLTFSVLKEAETVLDWEYGGSNGAFDTVMYKDGSPPQNILLVRPQASTFNIGKPILDPSKVDTGVPLDKYILATGVVLILFGAFMVFSRPVGVRKKIGTVVVYDEE